MFGSIGGPELIVILVVALLIFGPRKLPELGRTLGRGLSELRRASNDLKVTLDREIRTEGDDTRDSAPRIERQEARADEVIAAASVPSPGGGDTWSEPKKTSAPADPFGSEAVTTPPPAKAPAAKPSGDES